MVGKKSFIAYVDWHTTFEALSVKEAGQLIQMIFDYVLDKNPKPPSRVIGIAFEAIRQDLKRDLKKWDEELTVRSESGKLGNLKRWHKDLYEKVISGEKTIKEVLIIAKGRTPIKGIANIAVNDNVNVNVNVNERGGKKFTPPTKEDVFNEMILKIDNFTANAESEKFCDFYNSKGWMVGKNKMKDWKSAVRNWIRGMNKFEKNGNTKTGTSTARVDALKNW